MFPVIVLQEVGIRSGSPRGGRSGQCPLAGGGRGPRRPCSAPQALVGREPALRGSADLPGCRAAGAPRPAPPGTAAAAARTARPRSGGRRPRRGMA